MNDDLALSIAVQSIKKSEGCRLVAYNDTRGYWTIGWGESELVDKSIRQGMVWSQQHADSRFSQRLAIVFHAVKVAWPGAERLHPKAQAALISLAYNRGTSLTKKVDDANDRRREMRELQSAVSARDYLRMAQLISSMKRLWVGTGQNGLLTRRDHEAELCTQAAEDAAGLNGRK